MALAVDCPQCRKKLKFATDKLAGKKIKCPKCQKTIKVPYPSADSKDALLAMKEEDLVDDDSVEESQDEDAEPVRKPLTSLYETDGTREERRAKKIANEVKPFPWATAVVAPLLVVVGLGLVGGGGFFVWQFIANQPSAPIAQSAPTEPATAAATPGAR